MTSTQTDIADQLSALAEQMKAAQQATATPDVDKKYQVTSEFTEAPKALVTPLLKKLDAAQKKADAAKTALEAAKKEIIELMAGSEVLVIEETKQEVVSHRVVNGYVFDTNKFKTEHPELVGEYQKPRVQRPFKRL